MMFQIRRATTADAAEGVATLHRSIVDLCSTDHRGDRDRIAAWLSNKTEANWNRWVQSDDSVVLVAIRNSAVVSVGAVRYDGHILLNYVHPSARFSGVSKGLLAALEAELIRRGVWQCELESTLTARRFYESCGFRSKSSGGLGLSKSLASDS